MVRSSAIAVWREADGSIGSRLDRHDLKAGLAQDVDVAPAFVWSGRGWKGVGGLDARASKRLCVIGGLLHRSTDSVGVTAPAGSLLCSRVLRA